MGMPSSAKISFVFLYSNLLISFPVLGESEILKFQGKSDDLKHLGRPYFRSNGKTYRIRNGYTVTLVCSIENLGKLFFFVNI